LKESVNSLDNVVVVGYGTQKSSAVTGAVTNVALDAAESRSVQSPVEILQGKAAGVIVTQEGGDPTAGPRINIRGLGGINGEKPLYVLDGSIFNGVPPINPNDIESITVLKDAAASIYGARASGGVIVINTKKGKSDQATINLDVKYGSQAVWKKLEALNAKEYADVMNQAADNGGKPRLDAFNAAIYPDGQITCSNWVDEVFRTGKVQDYNVNVNGRGNKSNYYLSFGYRKADGILLNTFSERYNFMVNSEHQLRPWLKLGEKLNFSNTSGIGANTSSEYTGAIITAIFYPPSISPYTEDGRFSGLPATYAGAYGDVINPVAYLKRLDNNSPVNNLFVNPYIQANIFRGMSFRSSLAINKRFSSSKSFEQRVLEIGKISDYNQLSMASSNSTNLLAEQTLTYDTRWGRHHLDALTGYTYQHDESEGFAVYAQGFDDERPEYRYFTNATMFYKPSGSTVETAIISYLGRVNYGYDDKYMITVIGRRDGSSLVSEQNRFRNYGSVSGGWALNRETFMNHINWLDQLKLRASYGILGNLGSLQAGSVVVPLAATEAYLGLTPTLMPGYAERALSNPNITWAQSKQLNMGIDMAVLQSRITLTADYFIKTTSDMILSQQPASTTGVPDATWINGGKARDKGFELSVGYYSKREKKFRYSLNAVLTKLNNELISLNEGVTAISTNQYNIRGAVAPLLIQTGNPLYSYYVVKTDGLFRSQAEVDAYTNKEGDKIQPNAKPGDLKFIDNNEDGKIDNNDRVVMGSAYPGFSYGLSMNASYKNFDLNIFMQGVQNNKLFNGTKFMGLQASLSGQNYNMLKDILGAWSPENINSNIPRVTQSDQNNNFRTTSDWFIEDGSYMRVKNITLGYTMPDKLIARTGFSLLRVYVTANNLFTFTRYSGFDPEVGMDNYGIDNGRYPQSRSVFAGLNINF